MTTSVGEASQNKHDAVISSLHRLSVEIGRLESITDKIEGTANPVSDKAAGVSDSPSLSLSLASWPKDIEDYAQRVSDAVNRLGDLLY